MTKNLKGIVSKEHVARKEFSYVKDGVRLAFTLRTDIKAELKAFIDLIKTALPELESELEKVGQ